MVRHFIWTGDVLKIGLITMSSKSFCAPKQNGRLQVLDLKIENKAYLLQPT